MKVNLLRGNRPHGTWFSVELMIEDLSLKRVVLEPGDKLFVYASEEPRLSIVRDPPNLNLVTIQ